MDKAMSYFIKEREGVCCLLASTEFVLNVFVYLVRST